MQRYIEQLIEGFRKAAREASPKEIDYGETYEKFEAAMLEVESAEPVPPEEQFGVSYKELPSSELLTDDEMERLTDAIVAAVEASGGGITFPDKGNAPSSIRYEALREHFKEGFYAMPGWHTDFCSGWCPDCIFADYCKSCKEIWTKEDLEKERMKNTDLE